MDELGELEEVLAPARGFMHLDAAYTAFETARVVVMPIPFDATTCYRPGTREGPQAIIDASRNLELYDPELRRAPYRAGIHTLRAIEPIMGDAAAMAERVERITGHLLDRGKFVAMLGGDHSTSIGVVRAFARRHPQMSVLQLDAHADLRDTYEGTALSSATIMRRVLDVCPRTAQVGIRSLSEPEARLVEERHLPLWLASDLHARALRGDHGWIEEVVEALADEVYVTVDIDAFDPSFVPGTGTPEPGGLGWYEVMDLLAAVATRKRIVGFDLVELSPLVEGHVSPVVAAKVVYKLLGLALPDAG
ncbi:MAG: agmatinase [Ktedonobacterales bacterium]|nr:agmatinase [Ktedonobacterales bacterium]